MPAAGPALAGGAAAGQAAPGRGGQSPACRGRTCAPSARRIFATNAKAPEVAAARGHAAKIFSPTPLCDRPGCHEPPVKSGRNQARYCCCACRQAVRRVLDRERKWRLRGTFQGRRAREQEYQAARARRREQQHDTASATSARPPPS